MNQVPLSRTNAEGRARAAQFTCAAMCMCAIAVIAFAIPVITSVPTLDEVRPPPVAPPVQPSGESSPAQKLAVNSSGISDRFMQFANRPVQAAPPDVTENPDETPAETPTTPEAPRFLGIIREPGRMLAMVRVNGKQKIMAEGEAVGTFKVVRIETGAITIEVDGVERQLEKQARTGAVTSVAVEPEHGVSVMPEGAAGGRNIPYRPDQERVHMDGREEPSAAPQIRRQRPVPQIPAAGRRTAANPNR